MEDPELLERFLAGTLESFPHRDHVRTAYLLLERHDFDEASAILSTRIRAMAATAGNPGKFHVTRTLAWMRLVCAAKTDATPSPASEEFLRRHPHLLDSHLLDEHYSGELLGSPGAREAFVEPDLRALP